VVISYARLEDAAMAGAGTAETLPFERLAQRSFRQIGAAELASLLRGPSWPGARRVALDPLPGALYWAAAFDLLLLAGMDRDRFAQRLAHDARDARRRRG